jgi:hypothetical protein
MKLISPVSNRNRVLSQDDGSPWNLEEQEERRKTKEKKEEAPITPKDPLRSPKTP